MPIKTTASTLRVRVVVDSPPKGVVFCVQCGRKDLLPPTLARGRFIHFDLELRIGTPFPDGTPNYLGDFAQGTPADRFVYINSGTLAGQPDSVWTRRAKLKLRSIPPEIAHAAIGSRTHIVEARVVGTMADGGPVCASVKPEAVTWALVKHAD